MDVGLKDKQYDIRDILYQSKVFMASTNSYL